MKTLVVSEFTRPTIQIEEIEKNGVKYLGMDARWAAVDFISDEAVGGFYHSLQLQHKKNPSEVWQFTKVNVMLYPNPKNNPNRYILTFDQVCRVTK